MTQTLADIQALSIILASFVAIRGISAWSREHAGKKRIDVAEEMLAVFYQAKDAISYIRGPDGFYGAGDPQSASPNALVNASNVTIKRMNEHAEMFAHLRTMRYRAMVLFGDHAARPFVKFDEILEDIRISSYLIAHTAEWESAHPDMMAAHVPNPDMEKWKRSLIEHPGEDDPLKGPIDEMMEHVVAICRPAISGGLQRRWPFR